MEAATNYDVAIVGYGPVGQTLATLLGRQGWSVLVLDKQAGLYPLPRACHLDHEAMRILQAMAISKEINDAIVPAREYLLLRADLSVLSNLPRGWETPSGWESSYHFYQPDIEGIFDATAKSTPGVTVRQATNVRTVSDLGDRIELKVDGGTEPIRARFVVGADGANSLVREQAGIARDDLGFEATWVVIDVEMKAGAKAPKVPDTGQVLDPAQPSHMAWLGGDHYRWEFMIVDGDDPVEAAKPENVWSKLRRWITPETATLLRSTTYTFQSLVASTFNRGRVLLAGDAAHLMPPFMGQGMISGMRDAMTLSWTLNKVLTGTAPIEFLDAYTDSRRPHVTEYIAESVRVGQMVCETDPAKAAERDRKLEAQTEAKPPFQPRLGAGFVDGPLGGRLAVQPRIAGAQDVLLDDLLGSSLTLLTVQPEVLDSLSATAKSHLELLDVSVAAICAGPAGATPRRFVEQGSRFADWLGAADAEWVLVRPDAYVFDAGKGAGALEESIDQLRAYITREARMLAGDEEAAMLVGGSAHA
ncbi:MULTISPECIES: bifunctional 3-(3-hydroxy-phenyl)propionate/3-hydroxycinnamic acid hydroxylase [unclassified Arthrobacter]|uniref:bifunctional 3-(3-hydroxy-phenyl)propionate/3-hydroxycinnamic acid hydroxylase n=1 Tax=unclassified Arthrobacter TaxID=235627 RepID=UPI001C863A65|nr:bifunctional 3-(3-hydroxy-phenyl)propionate/3-hydroxycinnamic acid hydroxylase [Arthrobacter sp. MAHUQ-56]MBX7444381.1 bifunctional 3-(3-hydroxy-phenyl)propionate/3-hydroxycinnamic acid hydroxylase [Arthrobacter sp. MAHUQ-56]